MDEDSDRRTSVSVLLLVFTDGRDDLLDKTLESADDNLIGPVTRMVIHTDRDPQHVNELSRRYPSYEVCGGSRVGFGGAINRAWSMLRHCDEPYIFHLEDDFTFNRPVPLLSMMSVLAVERDLIQMALRRQPWSAAERTAGGVVEMWPESYIDRQTNGHGWLEHRLFFSTNPSLYRRELMNTGWPTNDRSELEFSEGLFSNPNLVCGYWGARDSGEWVTHIGQQRAGTGY